MVKWCEDLLADGNPKVYGTVRYKARDAAVQATYEFSGAALTRYQRAEDWVEIVLWVRP